MLELIAAILVAHLVGDYLLQSHWMATQKTSQWFPAIVHGVAYTIPFTFITLNPWSLLIIGGTHAVIDRYRLAKYVVWFKNQLAPKSARSPWNPAPPKSTDMVKGVNYEIVSGGANIFGVDPKRVITGRLHTPEEIANQTNKNTGFPKSTPDWLATWLMIITDNTIHILINILAIGLFL